MNWDEYFIKHAITAAEKSKDPSTKIGSVIVGPDHEIRSTGYNGMPRGIDESIPERWDRKVKYFFLEHGERNAIYNAARIGTSTKGCTLYLNVTPKGICADCARAIIQAGIIRVVGPNLPFTGQKSQWELSTEIAQIMLEEAGVQVDELSI